MYFTKKQVDHLAHIARINIDQKDSEAKLFKIEVVNRLNCIFDMVKQINDINIHEVSQIPQDLNMIQPLRVDEVTEMNQRDELQLCIDKKYYQAGLYLVPKVFE